MSPSDEVLIALVLAREDRHAFAQLVQRHQGMVRAQLRRLSHGDLARADDLAQEVFLIAWSKLHQFRGQSQFSTWLHRIAYTCFLRDHRKNPALLAGQAEGDEPAGPSVDHDLKLDIERAFQQLAIAEQRVLLHHVQMGLSHEETAYVLDMPLGTVKSHATRGKAKLQELLKDWSNKPTRKQTS
jgi:RNA polymerase sigma factor (sigma-70 family)